MSAAGPPRARARSELRRDRAGARSWRARRSGGCALEARIALLGEDHEDAQRVLQRDLGQLAGGGVDETDVLGQQGALKARIGVALTRHEHMFAPWGASVKGAAPGVGSSNPGERAASRGRQAHPPCGRALRGPVGLCLDCRALPAAVSGRARPRPPGGPDQPHRPAHRQAAGHLRQLAARLGQSFTYPQPARRRQPRSAGCAPPSAGATPGSTARPSDASAAPSSATCSSAPATPRAWTSSARSPATAPTPPGADPGREP